MSLSKENKYPEIRFKGFTETWEQRKFFDNIETTIDFRGRTPKKLGLDWSEKGYLALSALNVKNGFIDPKADAHYGNQTLYNKWMGGRELRKGQVLFTTEAPMGNVAQVPDDQGYILSQRTIAFEVKCDKMTNNFLSILLRSPKAFNELTSLSSGGTAKGVSQKSLSHFNVIVPTDLEEQQKIGLLFKKLDNAIALHQCKLDKLNSLKKAYLQFLFPEKDKNSPRIRFVNFTKNWEQRKVGEFLSESRISGSNGKVAKKLTVKLWRKGVISKEDKYQGSEATNYYIRKKGQFIYGKLDFLNQAFGIIPDYLDGYESTLDLPSFNISKNLDSFFFIEYISRKQFYLYQGIIANGSRKAKRIHPDTFYNMPLLIPNIKEQFKIGLFFKQIDNTINLHQQKLHKLKELKKAYLKKMFV